MLSASALLGFAQCKHRETWCSTVPPALQGGIQEGSTKCVFPAGCKALGLVPLSALGTQQGKVTHPLGGWSTAFISQGSALDPPSAPAPTKNPVAVTSLHSRLAVGSAGHCQL